jgi:hypothetical protein
MLEAVGRPRDGLESLVLDRSAVDHAATKCAVLDAPQCVSHLLQHRRIEFHFSELLALSFISHARIAGIAGRILGQGSCIVVRAHGPPREARFKVQQTAFVLLHIHDGSSCAPPDSLNHDCS